MTQAATQIATPALVLREDRGGIARITLNRPEQFNALSRAVLDQFEHVLNDLAGDRSVRVVVVAANGKAFCPGHDLKEMLAQRTPEFVGPLFEKCAQVMLALTRLPQVVIARVHGIATAAGCQLVAACDLAVASSEARFATSGINFGLFCATPGVPVSRSIGRKQALEMLLTGEFIDADTALAWGLVNKVVAPDALDGAIDALCRTLLAKPPAALAGGKRFFYRQAELGMEDAYKEAAALITSHMLADEAFEGVNAFIAKRKPSWPT
ncbi:MAG: enoyl-CoA hydratase [Burkholderiales bacterium]|nr:enoyl-CoA hydratase [Burkholderiales bacterium]